MRRPRQGAQHAAQRALEHHHLVQAVEAVGLDQEVVGSVPWWRIPVRAWWRRSGASTACAARWPVEGEPEVLLEVARHAAVDVREDVRAGVVQAMSRSNSQMGREDIFFARGRIVGGRAQRAGGAAGSARWRVRPRWSSGRLSRRGPDDLEARRQAAVGAGARRRAASAGPAGEPRGRVRAALLPPLAQVGEEAVEVGVGQVSISMSMTGSLKPACTSASPRSCMSMPAETAPGGGRQRAQARAGCRGPSVENMKSRPPAGARYFRGRRALVVERQASGWTTSPRLAAPAAAHTRRRRNGGAVAGRPPIRRRSDRRPAGAGARARASIAGAKSAASRWPRGSARPGAAGLRRCRSRIEHAPPGSGGCSRGARPCAARPRAPARRRRRSAARLEAAAQQAAVEGEARRGGGVLGC